MRALRPTRTLAISHSDVTGVRARLKVERFWFDSRGWDSCCRWFTVTDGCATPVPAGSIPVTCSCESADVHACAHVDSRQSVSMRDHQGLVANAGFAADSYSAVTKVRFLFNPRCSARPLCEQSFRALGLQPGLTAGGCVVVDTLVFQTRTLGFDSRRPPVSPLYLSR